MRFHLTTAVECTHILYTYMHAYIYMESVRCELFKKNLCVDMMAFNLIQGLLRVDKAVFLDE